MYEPHLVGYDHHADDRPPGEGISLLDELDKIAPLKSFDAFPKRRELIKQVQSTYVSQSRRGGVLTAVVGLVIFLLVLNDLGEYLYGNPDYAFQVDQEVQKDLQLNVDLTVAMPCRYLTIDLRDAVGDRLHLSDAFVKEGTTFSTGKAVTASVYNTLNPSSASDVITSARRRTPNQRRTFSGIQRLFSSSASSKAKRQQAMFRPTYNKVADGPACRIYGSVEVKKVTANLHITTLGHGYISFEHTDHGLMNLSHVVHEFSFGPFFPAISQPLDMTMQVTQDPFVAFQYFLRVVPTTYIDANRRKLVTSQYAVTDYNRVFAHGAGVPGVFFKYDLEAMALTIRERTTSLYQFLIRLVGVIGGVWTVASFGLRVFNRAQKQIGKKPSKEKELMPSSMASPAISRTDSGSGYFGAAPRGNGQMLSRGPSWAGSVPGGGPGGGGSPGAVSQDWKAR